MFRCPNCAQCQTIEVTLKNGEKYEIIMNKEMDKVTFKNDIMTIDPEHALHESVMNRIKGETSLEQHIECPKCNEVEALEQFFDAKENTLNYHEMSDDQLCHCGGEMYMDNIPGTTKYGFVCEDCNWVKPKKVVNGG